MDWPSDDLSPADSLPGGRPHDRWMRLALEEARAAAAEDEVPVGAIVVAGGRVVGSGHNQREQLADPTAHAEMIAITQAAATLGSWRLEGCTLYVTLEPCPMCMGACVNARLGRLVFACRDPKAGAAVSVLQLGQHDRLNHRMVVTEGVRRAEASELLSGFFESLRRRG
jgi:tRNA(adenine34) deaminase